MIGGKDLLLSATKRRYQTVKVPLLDAEFRIQSLTGKELNEFVGAQGKNQTEEHVQLLSMCLVDEGGNRLFTNGDAAQLRDLDLAVVVPLINACQEHNFLLEKHVERLSKN